MTKQDVVNLVKIDTIKYKTRNYYIDYLSFESNG